MPVGFHWATYNMGTEGTCLEIKGPTATSSKKGFKALKCFSCSAQGFSTEYTQPVMMHADRIAQIIIV